MSNLCLPIADYLFIKVIMDITKEKAINATKEKFLVVVLICKVFNAFFLPKGDYLKAKSAVPEYQGSNELPVFQDELPILSSREGKHQFLDCLYAWSLCVYVT